MAQALLSTEYSTIPTPYDGFDRMPLNGEWRGGRIRRVLEDRDPYSNDVLTRIPLANEQEYGRGLSGGGGRTTEIGLRCYPRNGPP